MKQRWLEFREQDCPENFSGVVLIPMRGKPHVLAYLCGQYNFQKPTALKLAQLHPPLQFDAENLPQSAVQEVCLH